MKKLLLFITLGVFIATVLFLALTREPPYSPDTESEEIAHKHAPTVVGLLKDEKGGEISLHSLEWVALKADLHLGLPGEEAGESIYAEAVMYFFVYEHDDETAYAIASYYYDKKEDPEYDIILYANRQKYQEAVKEFEEDLNELEAEMHQERQQLEAIYEDNKEFIEGMGFDVRLLFDANRGTFPEEQLPIYLEEAS